MIIARPNALKYVELLRMNVGTFFFKLKNLFNRSFMAPMGQTEHQIRAPKNQLMASIGHQSAHTSNKVTLASGDWFPKKAMRKIRLKKAPVIAWRPTG